MPLPGGHAAPQMELATDAAVRRARRLIKAASPLDGGGASLLTPAAEKGVEQLLNKVRPIHMGAAGEGGGGGGRGGRQGCVSMEGGRGR